MSATCCSTPAQHTVYIPGWWFVIFPTREGRTANKVWHGFTKGSSLRLQVREMIPRGICLCIAPTLLPPAAIMITAIAALTAVEQQLLLRWNTCFTLLLLLLLPVTGCKGQPPKQPNTQWTACANNTTTRIGGTCTATCNPGYAFPGTPETAKCLVNQQTGAPVWARAVSGTCQPAGRVCP